MQPEMSNESIVIRGARVHNLTNVDIDIPRNQLVVFTGLSGSGKSSLAFDTIYAEGQRRYVESLSAYARQFLGIMEKPDVDKIEGLSPAISIDQKSVSKNPRSTVGTITEIYDYFRLLFARAGIPHDPHTGQPMTSQTIDEMVNVVLEYQHSDVPIYLLAPIVVNRKGEHKQILGDLEKQGFMRVRIDGVVYLLDDLVDTSLDEKKRHTIEVVLDRILDESGFNRARVRDSVETAVGISGGYLTLAEVKDKMKNEFANRTLSQHYGSPETGFNLEELEPRNFSFNSPYGACPTCDGLGTQLQMSPDLVIPNPKLSIKQGAIRPWLRFSRQKKLFAWYQKVLDAFAHTHEIDLNQPVQEMSEADVQKILYGDGTGSKVTVPSSLGKDVETTFEGVIPILMKRYQETDSDFVQSELEQYMVSVLCPTCNGKRLKREYLWVKVANRSIAELTNMSIEDLYAFCKEIHGNPDHFDEHGLTISNPILKEIVARIGFLLDVGLDYLSLDRSGRTLSGGEAQRIRLATQIGSGLVGVLYILDEPSIGLHQRDNTKLIRTLERLRDSGNTVMVVEHDEETINRANHVIDIGPQAGEGGGNVVAEGTPAEVSESRGLTGEYLSGRKKIQSPQTYRKGHNQQIIIKGAAEHNLNNIDVSIPLGQFLCVTGVSGSGKSTLVETIFRRAVSRRLNNARDVPGKHKDITGLSQIDKLVNIDQSPIGRTPRSNPATYTGVFTHIRELFAQTQEAKARGYKPGRFSFNVQGGRCETCKGDGVLKIEMNFLPDVYVDCQECHGKRYNKEALEILYHQRTISDVLNMEVDTALEFFKNIPAIRDKLATLSEVGLGYIKLGQPATELSGGEAQRIKLATELSKRSTGKTFYILDEPTTGLHFEDVNNLLSILHRLVDKGNTVMVIEHHLDVIKNADHILDLGPDGGSHGGDLVATGTPHEVAEVDASYTGKFLKEVLE